MNYIIGLLKNLIFRPWMVIKSILIIAFLIVLLPFERAIDYLHRRKLMRELKDIFNEKGK